MRISEVTIPKELRANISYSCGNPTLGGDPEFFIANKHGKILNSDAFLPHKDEPIHISVDGDIIDPERINHELLAGKLYFDGIQGELNFNHSHCRVLCLQRISNIMNKLFEMANNHKIVIKPVVRVKKEILEKAHPDARIFGCMPDFNAYTLTTNTCEMNASKHPFRYAGGHIHIGIPTERIKKAKRLITEKGQLQLVKCLDLVLNLVTLSLDNSNAAKIRRTKYGKAGCFRPTPYGVEYRSLSCWWLKSPITTSLALGLARVAYIITYHNRVRWLMNMLKVDEQDIEGCINESDVVFAKKVWDKLRVYLSGIGVKNNNPFVGKYGIGLLDYVVKHGVDHILKPIEEEWKDTKYSWLNKNSFEQGAISRLEDRKYNIHRYIDRVWNSIY